MQMELQALYPFKIPLFKVFARLFSKSRVPPHKQFGQSPLPQANKKTGVQDGMDRSGLYACFSVMLI